MIRLKNRFRQGAASFYIVAFSTIILMILASSFAAVVLSGMARSSNDDLSQSAYDSALAGVEDAKLAFANYKRCLETIGDTSNAGKKEPNSSEPITCEDIIYWVEHESSDCDQVAHILGRIGKDDEREVLISGTQASSDGKVVDTTNQAYTCVMLKDVLSDYRATLTSNESDKLVKVKFDNKNSSDVVSKVKTVKISWYSSRNVEDFNYNNILNREVAFQPSSATVPVPPTLQVQIVQTAKQFNLSQFDKTSARATNRATVFMVPTNDQELASKDLSNNYFGQYDTAKAKNMISAEKIANTNNRLETNLPFVVYCPENSTDGYACTVELELPDTIGGGRNEDTFMFVISLPYGEPDTDFALEFYCADGTTCSKQTVVVDNKPTEENSSQAKLKGVQVNVDSTGRANDLYRRVEVRLESKDNAYLSSYPMYAVELLGKDTNLSKKGKDYSPTVEYGVNIGHDHGF